MGGRRWLISAGVLFGVFLVLWTLAAIWVGSSLGASFPLLADLKTRILADYSPDILGNTLKALRLTILGEVSTDSDLSADTLADLALDGLVPTATSAPGAGGLISSPTSGVGSNPNETPSTLTVTPSQTSTSTITVTGTSPPTVTTTGTKTPQPTHTDKPQNTPIPTDVPEAVIPKLECVVNNHDGSYTAYFGYKNPNDFPVEIEIGLNNYFYPDPEDQGQPTKFSSGRSPGYPNASFSVVFDEESIKWHLDGGKVRATASSPPCEPESTPEPPQDTQPPLITGGVIMPPPGGLASCTQTISIESLRVVDPAPSSGLAWVKLKYDVAGFTGYLYSEPLSLVSGGPTVEGGWDGIYSGSFEIHVDPSWVSSEPFFINLWSKAKDNAGFESYLQHGEYTMPASCGSTN